MDCSCYAALCGLTVYRDLLTLPPVASLGKCLRALDRERGRQALDAYANVFFSLAREGYGSLSDYLTDRLRFGVSPYGEAVARGTATPRGTAAARKDIPERPPPGRLRNRYGNLAGYKGLISPVRRRQLPACRRCLLPGGGCAAHRMRFEPQGYRQGGDRLRG